MKNKPLPVLITALSVLGVTLGIKASAQTPKQPTAAVRDLGSDTWVATDALGRSLPTAGQVRPPHAHRFVGIFYFLWQYPSPQDVVYDNTKILADPTQHGYGPFGSFHWWGEPAVGYFTADDPWVHRKNLQMLADAGVDVIFFDATNAFTYEKSYLAVCRVAEQMHKEGNPCPQIAFLTHSGPGKTVTKLYDDFYSKGLYSNLWFRWDGKPLILGEINGKMDNGTPMSDQVRNFFTWRDSWAWDPGQDKWQWLDKYPQRAGWHTSPSIPEEVPVAMAGHPSQSLGRSFHSTEDWGGGTEPPVDAQYLTPQMDQGIQFSQQWQQALKIDPQFIFITGWNEWIAQRFTATAPGEFAGRPMVVGQPTFVDNYTEEFSRDAMPMKGGFGDDYYMQMVDGIRRFKGAGPVPVARTFKSIRVAQGLNQWMNVQPVYQHQKGDTMHRDWEGWGKGNRYVNNTGRNNITSTRVACDAKNIYFYVHTAQPLTAWSGHDWMQLAIDADRDPATGWNGYDYVINSHVLSSTKTTLKRLSDGKTWTVPYKASFNEMQIAVPRALLGLKDIKNTSFDFHWVDNAPVGSGDIADWWYNGESAPDGRFNYRYVNKHA